MIRIHNTQTDEVIDREMTDAEFAEYIKEATATAERLAAEAAEAEDKLAILQQLGLTDDQAIVLGLLSKPQAEQSTPMISGDE